MKATTNKTERGQVLVLFALAAIALFGLGGLAIDGANAYSDRRQAQNAADAAAFAAAVVRAEKGTITVAKNAALQRATDNGYADADPNANTTPIDVVVEIPPTDGAYAGKTGYIQVKIHTTTNTFLAKLLGINTMSSDVSAVAVGVPVEKTDLFNGSAMLSLNPNACQTMKFTGSSKTVIQKGGIFSNSKCNDGGPQQAFYLNNKVEAPWVEIVGGAYVHDTLTLTGSSAIQAGVDQIPYPPPIKWPTEDLEAACDKNGDQNDSGTSLNPGKYDGFSPNKDVTLAPGVYCVMSGNFSLNKNVTGTGVTFYIKSGKVTINGGSTINVSAPTSGAFQGLLLFTPMENNSNVIINGSATSAFTGSIMSPGSEVTLSGGGNSSGFKSQVIGDVVEVTGDQSLYLNYEASQNYTPNLLPYLQLTQ